MNDLQVGTVRFQGWRKFSLAVVLSLMGFAGMAFDKMTGAEFVSLAQMVMLFFGAANVGVHFAKRGNNNGEENPE